MQAGLIPALRNADASPPRLGDRRDATRCVPVHRARSGARPAPLKNRLATPSLLWDHDSDVLRAVLRILPDDGSRLLLVVDQFEELFVTVHDADARSLSCAASSCWRPIREGRSRVLVTLRADFYDRPLLHPAFGRLMTGHVVDVMPLAARRARSGCARTGVRGRRHTSSGGCWRP